MGDKYKNIHQELIDSCRQGNSKAQFEIYKLYYKAMYNTCLRLLNDSMEAEDILQEAFLSAFSKLDTYREEVSFGAWLKRIVVNRSLDLIKKRKLDLEPIEEYKLADVPDEVAASEDDVAQQLAEVKKAIAQLPENYRVLITLHLIEGYDHEEVSDILEMSNSAVRTGYSRARKRLKEIMATKKSDIWMN